MTVKLSQDSFAALLVKSGLVAEDALTPLIDEFRASEPEGPDEGQRLAQFLIRKGDLTTWQAKKLLQGKHKGFTLGKYKLMSLLGRGGMSSVYLAEHLVMRRRCAIKVLPGKHVNDSAALTRFHQEAQAVAALDDPNIVRAYDVDHVREGSNEIHFLVMEYVKGRSLQELVDQDGLLSVPDAVDYIAQAAKGLGHAHQAGMVHRDVKPSNLLLDLSGVVKVLDMGLARFFEQPDQQSLTLQHDQRVLGTADYLSPEQAVDSHGVDTRSDIYSLGGTLYFLLTGHPPFPDGTLAQRLLAHQTKQPKPVSDIRPDVPASFCRILERMMSKSPDDRQSSADEARDELLAWLDQHGESFTQLESPSSVANRRKSRKPAEETSDGWSELAPERFTPPPGASQGSSANMSGNSHVVSDPNLGDFLSALSTQVDQTTAESDRITGEKTVVSKSRTKKVAVPTTPVEADTANSSVTADSVVRPGKAGSGVQPETSGSKSLSGSQIRRRNKTKLPMPVLAGGAGLLLLLMGGYFLWPSSTDTPPAGSQGAASVATTPADSPSSGGESPSAPAADARPPVEPGADITVGPQGNFATITEAVNHVREHFQPLSATEERTIRVAGGQTYAESIVIDNSQFGAFPQGVRIICSDAKPAILAPNGSEPIVTLLNVERFRLQGFELSGGGRPVAMRLEGYLTKSTFEKLTIDNVQTAAIQAAGISGFGGRRVEFRDLLIHKTAPEAVGLSFGMGERPTKELLIYRCRFSGQMAAGLRIEGEAANIEIKECRINNAATAIRFAGSSQQLENISLTNNTFRGFSQAVAFSSAPTIGSRGIGFHKNLFAVGSGPEVLIESGGGSLKVGDLVKGLDARFNWSEGTGDLPAGGVDVFANDGGRGIPALKFAGTDPTNLGAFLKPMSAELQTAAKDAPAPKFIGAVPAGGNP